MNAREKINASSSILILAAAIAILLAIFYTAHVLRSARLGSAHSGGKAFFTIDDGATLFQDDAGKVPPFQHDGHEAVRAMVFTCDGGQHHWVQYLEKYSGEAKPVGVEGALVVRAKP